MLLRICDPTQTRSTYMHHISDLHAPLYHRHCFYQKHHDGGALITHAHPSNYSINHCTTKLMIMEEQYSLDEG